MNRSLKYSASKADIVDDFYDEIQRLIEKHKANFEILDVLGELEDIAVWWYNTPALHEKDEK